jgi:AcrR family transcriptional regulator
MGSAERRERERAELQSQILDAARAILIERGFEGLTMRAVADRIEYSAAALYKHFADRDELVRALCARDFYAFGQEMNSRAGAVAADPKTDPLDRLRTIGLSYAEFALSHPEQYRVMFMNPAPIDRDGIEFPYGDPKSDAYAMLALAVQAAQRAGHYGGLDKDLVAQTLWATMHGVLSLEIANFGSRKHIPFAPIQQRIETALEGVILGLAAQCTQRAHKRRPAASRRRRG